jgi:hypothetical protein
MQKVGPVPTKYSLRVDRTGNGWQRLLKDAISYGFPDEVRGRCLHRIRTLSWDP